MMRMMRGKQNPTFLAYNRLPFPLPWTLTHSSFQSHLRRVRMRHWICGMSSVFAIQTRHQSPHCMAGCAHEGAKATKGGVRGRGGSPPILGALAGRPAVVDLVLLCVCMPQSPT